MVADQTEGERTNAFRSLLVGNRAETVIPQEYFFSLETQRSKHLWFRNRVKCSRRSEGIANTPSRPRARSLPTIHHQSPCEGHRVAQPIPAHPKPGR
jgi:hypothetical protein